MAAPGPAAPPPAVANLTGFPLDGVPRGRRPDGGFALPRQVPFASIVNQATRTYRTSFDEALRNNRTNALAMRRDGFILECLRARQYPTAQFSWHIEPDDADDPEQKEVADAVTRLIDHIPNFQQFRMGLLEAIWYGRAAMQQVWGRRRLKGRDWLTIVDHSPVNGDKVQWTWDGTPVIIVNGTMTTKLAEQGAKIGLPPDGGTATALTDISRALVLEPGPWRDRFCINQHLRIDADFYEAELAGGQFGVGIRSEIYWLWWLKQEVLSQCLDLAERAGQGFTIFYYEQGNPASQAAVQAVAENFSANKTTLLFPRSADGKAAAGVERIEASLTGAEFLVKLIDEYFDSEIRRYILGQDLSSSSASTGLGSGVADLQANTFMRVLSFDAGNLEESLTRDLVRPLLRWNFPAADFGLRLKVDVGSPDPGDTLEAIHKAWSMGVSFDADEVRELTGCAKPKEGADVVQQSPGGDDGGGGPPPDADAAPPAGPDAPEPPDGPEPPDEPDAPEASERNAKPRRYAKARRADGETLAEWYAGILNALADAGVPPDDDLIEMAAESLDGTGWAVERDDDAGSWDAVEADSDDSPLQYRKRGRPTRYAAAKAPKGGVDIGGKFYRGGQWIPGKEVAKADPATKAKIEGAAAAKKAERAARGSVDPGKLDARLKVHADAAGELTADERRAAGAAWRALRDHHGGLALHRVEELADALERGLAAAAKHREEMGDPEATGAEDHLRRRLAAMHGMLEMAKAAGVTGEVKGKEKAKELWEMTKDEFKQAKPPDMKRGHDQIVAQAVKDGLPVPESALEPYPQLLFSALSGQPPQGLPRPLEHYHPTVAPGGWDGDKVTVHRPQLRKGGFHEYAVGDFVAGPDREPRIIKKVGKPRTGRADGYTTGYYQDLVARVPKPAELEEYKRRAAAAKAETLKGRDYWTADAARQGAAEYKEAVATAMGDQPPDGDAPPPPDAGPKPSSPPPAAPKPDAPGFTGTDSQGREWRDGVLVPTEEKPASAAKRPPLPPQAGTVKAANKADGVELFRGTPDAAGPLAGLSRSEQLKKLGDMARHAADHGGDPQGIMGGPPAGLDVRAFADDLRGMVARHADQAGGVGATIDEFYPALAGKYGLSKHDFLKAVAAVHAGDEVRTGGWGRMLDEVPDPELAPVIGSKVMGYINPPPTAPDDVARGDRSLNTAKGAKSPHAASPPAAAPKHPPLPPQAAPGTPALPPTGWPERAHLAADGYSVTDKGAKAPAPPTWTAQDDADAEAGYTGNKKGVENATPVYSEPEPTPERKEEVAKQILAAIAERGTDKEGKVYIPHLRAAVPGATRREFDDAVRQMRRDRRLRVIATGDLSRHSRDELNKGVQGENENFMSVMPTETVKPPAVEAAPAKPAADSVSTGVDNPPASGTLPVSTAGDTPARVTPAPAASEGGKKVETQATVKVAVRAGDRTEDADVPAPLANAAGRVELVATSGDRPIHYPKLHITLDDGMRKAGLTRATTSGEIRKVGDVDALVMDTNKGKVNISLATRPELRALVENEAAIHRAIGKVQARMHDEAAELAKAKDAPLLEKMRTEAAGYRAAIPPDHVEVEAKETGGYFPTYTVGGIDIPFQELKAAGIVHHGTAAAVRPGALGAFATEHVHSMPKAAAAALVAKVKADRQAKAAASAQRRHELKTTPIPDEAVAAARKYKTAERAWDAEDERAWAVLNQWGPYIDEQGVHGR